MAVVQTPSGKNLDDFAPEPYAKSTFVSQNAR